MSSQVDELERDLFDVATLDESGHERNENKLNE